MNMLKLFFLFAAMATLAQCEIGVEWVCRDTRSMGNCTRVPRITDLLQLVYQDSEDNEKADFDYCPHYIVERHNRCMRIYFNSCYHSLTEIVRDVFLAYIPLTDDAETLCDNNRPYKREFRQHMACTTSMLNADDDFEDYVDETEMQFGQLMDDMNDGGKCKVVSCFWRELNTKIRKECGAKTEKFSRIVLSNLWPVSLLSKLCYGQYFNRGPA